MLLLYGSVSSRHPYPARVPCVSVYSPSVSHGIFIMSSPSSNTTTLVSSPHSACVTGQVAISGNFSMDATHSTRIFYTYLSHQRMYLYTTLLHANFSTHRKLGSKKITLHNFRMEQQKGFNMNHLLS